MVTPHSSLLTPHSSLLRTNSGLLWSLPAPDHSEVAAWQPSYQGPLGPASPAGGGERDGPPHLLLLQPLPGGGRGLLSPAESPPAPRLQGVRQNRIPRTPSFVSHLIPLYFRKVSSAKSFFSTSVLLSRLQTLNLCEFSKRISLSKVWILFFWDYYCFIVHPDCCRGKLDDK